MSDITIDASELTAFGRRVASAHAMASVKVAQAVKKGAQNVKEVIISDLGSGYYNRVFSWGRRVL